MENRFFKAGKWKMPVFKAGKWKQYPLLSPLCIMLQVGCLILLLNIISPNLSSMSNLMLQLVI